MLELVLKQEDDWDAASQRFITNPSIKIKLEHSLLSVAKWEAKHEKVFLKSNKNNGGRHSAEEMGSYVRLMIITPSLTDDQFSLLIQQHITTIVDYIDRPMSAVKFREDSTDKTVKRKVPPTAREELSSDMLYYYITALNIPFIVEKWHLNRLITFIELCNRMNGKEDEKKATQGEIRESRMSAEEYNRTLLQQMKEEDTKNA